jgi:hypothetical protein
MGLGVTGELLAEEAIGAAQGADKAGCIGLDLNAGEAGADGLNRGIDRRTDLAGEYCRTGAARIKRGKIVIL